MAISAEYRAYLEDLFRDIPGVRFKGMFGGLGIFRDDAMFGLVAYEQLYFKVDQETQPRFAEAGSEPFVYEGKNKPISMSYWTAPDDALDDPDAFQEWAELGMAAARRAQAKKQKTRKPRKPGA